MAGPQITACTAVALLATACHSPAPDPAERQPTEASYRSFESLDAVRRWLAQNPNDHDAWLELSQRLMSVDLPIEHRDHDEALVAARRAVELNPSPGDANYATLGTALYLSGDVAAARAAYRSAALATRDSATREALEDWARQLDG